MSQRQLLVAFERIGTIDTRILGPLREAPEGGFDESVVDEIVGDEVGIEPVEKVASPSTTVLFIASIMSFTADG
jgi:hypothetical protein